MKTQNLKFGESVKYLAQLAGMQPYRFSNFDEKKNLRFKTYKNIFQEYKDNFNQQLLNETNKEALNYLYKRGLKKDAINEFRLGYVPWKNDFYDKLLKKYSEEEINLTGLYYKSDKTGKYIDRFNSRIIFPVNNISGETIAFGGRIIREGKLAKYINSPETEFYKKGNMIFNLDKAKDSRAETDEVIIVEGYMDVVSVYSSGIKNVISNSGTALTERQINLVWKFFSNPIICLDGDESGQKAAYRIAEKLFPFINENNKIFFTIMPDKSDPDDFIRKNGKNGFFDLIKKKEIIQSYIWNYNLSKINLQNPFEVSTFEKEIKLLSYSIKDEILKKYVLEDYLGKIKNLTPIQSSKQSLYFSKNFNKKNYKILNETKILHRKKQNLSKSQIIEYSILLIITKYFEITANKINALENLSFISSKNESLKNKIIELISHGEKKDIIRMKIQEDYKELLEEIEESSNIQFIVKGKNDQELLILLEELILDFKTENNLRKIESLEKKLINNLDEGSYSELMKLKSQLNRE